MFDCNHLTPLNTMRTFEAVARHLSFTNAARELHLTLVAVSNQIQSLEEYLGVKLFNRVKRRVLLTEDVQMLLTAVVSAFSGIQEALELINRMRNKHLGSASPRSLPPTGLHMELGPFTSATLKCNLHLQISSQEPIFLLGKTDLGVNWGKGKWESLECEHLLTLEYTPFCSPDLIDTKRPLENPHHLSQYRLLHENSYDKWQEWLKHACSVEVKFKRSSIFENTNLLFHAAIDGKGIANCGLEMVQEHLDSGRLIRLFLESIKSLSSYYVVFPQNALGQPLVRLFRDWLKKQTGLYEGKLFKPLNQTHSQPE